MFLLVYLKDSFTESKQKKISTKTTKFLVKVLKKKVSFIPILLQSYHENKKPSTPTRVDSSRNSY